MNKLVDLFTFLIERHKITLTQQDLVLICSLLCTCGKKGNKLLFWLIKNRIILQL
jgi:hypothetical protein